jgi:methylated-DNA-[protein]-cysteine S-methyltransferase
MDAMTDDLTAALHRGRRTAVDDASAEAAARAVERAGTLIDVAVASLDSPIGRLTLAATPNGLVRIGFHDEYIADDLAERLSPRVVEAPKRLDTVRRQLDEYFDGRRRHFRFALDLSLSTGDFRRRALEAARRIPPGETATYGDLAAEAGNPRAARAVGSAMATNPIPIVVPCHRVVPSTGGLGNYGGGVEIKAQLLHLEGYRG